MEPVVDGLEKAYKEKVEFRRIDANSKDGGGAFQAYKLLGHPSFVMINPAGEVLWRGLGEQSEEKLNQAIAEILRKQ